MKYTKIVLLSVFAVLVGTATWMLITTNTTKATDNDEVVEEPITSEVELEYVDDSEEESSSPEVVISNVSYSVEEDGVTYNFMFEIPTNYKDVIKGISECITEEFDSCDIFYPEVVDGTYQYDVHVNDNSYTVFLVE